MNPAGSFTLGSWAFAIDPVGNIVGGYYTSPTSSRAAIWRKNGNGVNTPTDLDTFLRPEATAVGWTLQSAFGINDRDDIVGTAFNPILYQRGARDIYSFVPSRSRLPDSNPVP